MRKNFENIGISDDFMFGTVMRNAQYCKPFLETVLGIKIERIEYPASQKVIDLKLDAKGVRLDVYVSDERHTVYNIEMQVSGRANLPKRSRYYQSMVDLNILNKGDEYQNLQKTYVIFVCTFDLFGEGRHIYTFENRCVQNLNLALGDETAKIFLNTKGSLDDVSEEMKSLLDYIDGKMPSDTYTQALDEEVKRICRSEEWRLDYMTLAMKFQEKYKDGYMEGEEIGKEIGRAEGIQMGKLDSLIELVEDRILTVEVAAQRAGMTVDAFLEYMREKK